MNRSFGFHINAMRITRGISIPVLAQNIGITEEDLKKLETGTFHASKDQILRLASYFEVSEREFLQLDRASRIESETAEPRDTTLFKKSPSALLKNSVLGARRIENMQRDLNILETRSVSIKMHVPVPPLRPFIDSIIYCKGHDLGHPFERTLPDGTSQLQIVIGEGGRDVLDPTGKQVQHLSRAWVMGMNSLPVTYRLCEVEGVIYVRFRPAGLYAFTRIHQVELNNRVADANVVFGSPIEDLWNTLAGCHGPEEMISHVKGFFLRKLNTVVAEPPMLSYMQKHIHSPLTQLAKQTGYSAKYLTKTFQKFIGVGPKMFQRIQRFHSAVSELNHLTGSIDWADIVFKHGYHDQAHFIKDFNNFSGLAPQIYLALGQSCSRYLHASHHLEHHF